MRSLIGMTVGVAATAALFLVAAAPSFGAPSAERYIVERLRLLGAIASAAGILIGIGAGLFPAVTAAHVEDDPGSVEELPRIGHRPCVQGLAGPFHCNMVDLMTFIPSGFDDFGRGGQGSDVWGWTDPTTRAEWVIAVREHVTSFIDASDPKNPKLVARLGKNGDRSLPSDVKVYENHAYIVRDAERNGIQVFDLTRLRGLNDDDAPVNVEPDAVYEALSNAHNIAINEDTGYAYVLGATQGAIHEWENLITVHPPSSTAGTYQARGASFGPKLDETGVSGDLVAVDDGVGRTGDGCQSLVDFPAGSIALADTTGSTACTDAQRARNAQDAGAIAMIVMGRLSLRGEDPEVRIPSVLMSRHEVPDLPASVTISANPDANHCDRGGLHIVDIREPKSPTYAGCFDDDRYTHDAQCVVYQGPDVRYRGRELCFAANPDSPGVGNALTIVDVTDKSNPVLVGKVFEGEPDGISHQGWLTPDQRYFLLGDELDNGRATPARTRTRVLDVTNLENPHLQAIYHHPTKASAHNLYIRGRYMYNANYKDGLRIVDITKVDHPGDEFLVQTPGSIDHRGLSEAACFDTDPFRDDESGLRGAWSSYPYFKSGVVALSGHDGLFLVKPRLGEGAASPPALGGKAPGASTSPPTGKAACLP